MSTAEGSPVPPAVENLDLGPIGPKERYEFTKGQEEVISDLSGKMGFVGAFLLALATLALVQVILVAVRERGFDAFAAINGLVYGCLGWWTMRASGAFGAVVATVGRDVTHLMEALGSLRRMYSLLYWILVVAVIGWIVLAITYTVR